MDSQRVIVQVPDSVRYPILQTFELEDKVPDFLEKKVKIGRNPIYMVPKGDLPIGTVSELVTYTIKGNGWILARVHQYRLPDDTITGGPDPKYIKIDDIVIVPEPKGA